MDTIQERKPAADNSYREKEYKSAPTKRCRLGTHTVGAVDSSDISQSNVSPVCTSETQPELRTLKRKIEVLLKEGGRVEATGGDSPLGEIKGSLQEIYQKARAKDFQDSNIPLDLVTRWQSEKESIGLDPDPVIQELAEQNVTERLQSLQSKFLQEGIEKFACKEFHTTLNNIMLCIQWYKKQQPDFIRKAFDKLEQDVLQLQKLETVPYRLLLPVAIRFIIVQRAIHAHHINELMPPELSQQEFECAYTMFDDLTYEALTREDLPITKRIKRSVLKSIFYLLPLGTVAYLEQYLSEKPSFLIWFCFDALSYKFFPRASRYSIVPCGFQVEPYSYQNHGVMSCCQFSFHDCFHAFMTDYDDEMPPSLYIQKAQKILNALESICTELELDSPTTEAIWFLMYFLVREKAERLDEERQNWVPHSSYAKDLKCGRFWIPKGMEKEHLLAAQEIIKHLDWTLINLS